MKSKNPLLRNRSIFRDYVNIFIKQNKYDNITTLALVKSVSSFAYKCHPGIFASAELEDVLFNIGLKFETPLLRQESEYLEFSKKYHFNKNSEKKNVFHLATTIYNSSGHSNFIANLIRLDPKSSHYLIITEQGKTNIPEKIKDLFSEIDGKIICFENENILYKAQFIREFVSGENSSVFIHTHPFDVIPIITFSVKQTPPVIFVNHADHAFWLGISIADIVLNIRDKAAEISEKRRLSRENFVLPVPLKKADYSLNKAQAKSALKIPDNRVLAISMGTRFKFVPNGQYNFFRTVKELLKQNPDLIFKIIGLSNNDDLESLQFIEDDRIELIGTLDDTELYKRAADIYIDPMPYGSYTSLLEFCAYGAYPFVTYSTNPLFNLTEDPSIKGLVKMAHSEEEYINEFNTVCSDLNMRNDIGIKLMANIAEQHYGTIWLNKFRELKMQVSKITHDPRRIMQTIDRLDENDNYFAFLGRDNIAKEYELLLNSIYVNAASLPISKIIKGCSLIYKLCLNKSLLYMVIFILALVKKKMKAKPKGNI